MEYCENDLKVLQSICSSIEARFPHVTAAFDGFVSPELGGPRDGYMVIEVFNVPSDQEDDLLDFAETKAEEASRADLRPISFGLWSKEETRTYWDQDLKTLIPAPTQSSFKVLECQRTLQGAATYWRSYEVDTNNEALRLADAGADLAIGPISDATDVEGCVQTLIETALFRAA